MKLTVNGQPREVMAETLSALLTELGYENTTVATALNGDFVAMDERDGRDISDGDRIEILAPMKGG